MKKIRVLWCISDNFGDKLNPYLIEKISGKKVKWTRKGSLWKKFLVIGSILNWCDARSIAWGPGVAYKNDYVHPKAKILAVRGPVSREVALRSGNSCPDVFGDPAMLLPEFYFPKKERTFELGIIPHYVDKDSVELKDERVNIIDVCQPIETVVDNLLTCKKIISSSLHGLIIADAYNIPAKWVTFSSKVAGDGTKFIDHFLSIGVEPYSPLAIGKGLLPVNDLVRLVKPYTIKFDAHRLWQACPFTSF
ncbi:MAG: polysaccharide pyruvyl transferase family protein [Deltaproteobacteria bacterium]|nr:polysaccharide pyruvyl transferase family protein [Deltaproteobacteria bacterium]